MFAENLANRLIGLLVTVGVLAAVYFFAIKPVLDTTENAFNSIDGTVNNAFEDFGVEGFNVDEMIDGNLNSVQRQIRRAGLNDAQQKRAERLVACIQRAQPNTARMQTCVDRFG